MHIQAFSASYVTGKRPTLNSINSASVARTELATLAI